MPLPTFALWSRQHLIPVALILLATFSLSLWGRRRSAAAAARIGRALGAVLVVYYLLESVVRVAVLGMPFLITLPFEMCSALFFIGAYAYFTGNQTAFDIVYFWTFAGTIHSLITPTPHAGFPHLHYFQYFLAHGLLILSAVYSAAGMRRGPRPGSLLRAFVALQVFIALVAVIDLATGQNYLYLRQKPPSPTLVDAFGPWPGYILVGDLVALVSFCLWNLPFVLLRRRAPALAEPRAETP